MKIVIEYIFWIALTIAIFLPLEYRYIASMGE